MIPKRFRQMMTEDFVVLRKVACGDSLQPRGEALMQISATCFREGLVRRVPDPDVLETKTLVAAAGQSVGPNQIAPHQVCEQMPHACFRASRRPLERSGSSCSRRLVEPITSAKTAVTILRTSRPSCRIGAAHAWQNRARSVFGSLHDGQAFVGPRSVPQRRLTRAV